MIKNIHKIIIGIYEKIFGEKITQNVSLFFKNLRWAIFGYSFAAFCVLVFEILAGRILGPNEYGKYVLVGIVGSFLYLFMTWGVSTAAIKYASGEDYTTQKLIISNAYFVIVGLVLFWGLIFLIFSSQISGFFSIPLALFRLSIVFGLFFSLYTLSIDSLRSLHKIKNLSFFRAGYGILILVIFAAFFLINNISFKTAVFVICFSYLIIFLLVLGNIRQYFSFIIDKSWIVKLLEYGLYAAIGGSLFTLLPTLGQLFVNKYLTIKDVGIYNAYYLSSINIVIFLNNVFITVFFPTASKHKTKESILKKIRKIIPLLFIFGIPGLLIFQLIILNIYGSQYPIKIILSFLFAIAGVLISVYSLYSWFLYSTGTLGAKMIMRFTIMVFIISLLLNYYLVLFLRLEGAILATIITYFLGLVYLFSIQKSVKIN